MTAATLTKSQHLLEKTYSAADLWEFPSDAHFELIEGKLRPMSMPTGDAHGKKTLLLTLFIAQFIIENDLGDGFAAETGFLISRSPDTVKAPDFGFVSHARLPKVRGVKYVEAVPDLVLETRSPSDYNPLAKAKIDEWLHAGVSVVLDLNPARQTLTVYQTNTPPQVLTPADTLQKLAAFTGLFAAACARACLNLRPVSPFCASAPLCAPPPLPPQKKYPQPAEKGVNSARPFGLNR